MTRSNSRDVLVATLVGSFCALLLGAALLVGSRNLNHFDPALVAYTFATLFATFGIAYRYTIWLRKPPTWNAAALKALAMARNVARQEGRSIRDFATAVFDLLPIAGDIHRELPKTDPGYYFRPYKTILVRTVADGGASYYFCGDHRATFPALRRAILDCA